MAGQALTPGEPGPPDPSSIAQPATDIMEWDTYLYPVGAKPSVAMAARPGETGGCYLQGSGATMSLAHSNAMEAIDSAWLLYDGVTAGMLDLPAWLSCHNYRQPS